MKVLLIGSQQAGFTGPSTYQALVLRLLSVNHEVSVSAVFPESPSAWDVIHLLDVSWAKPPSNWCHASAPLVVDVHDYYSTALFAYPCPDLPLRWINAVRNAAHNRSMLKLADQVATHCDYVTARVRHRQVTNVGIAVDMPGVVASAPHASREDIILFAGSNYFRKGLVTLRRALPRVLRQRPTARLVIAGYERAHSLRVARRMFRGLPATFLGPVPRELLIELYSRAKVYTLPSEIEASPVAPLEAAQAGTPSVCTDVGGIPEMVRRDETGLLVERGDHRALADALLRCMSDGSLAQRLVSASREDARLRFSPERLLTAIETCYASAMT